jgi:FlaA1/EpsC-like NDP-sugar epimerase
VTHFVATRHFVTVGEVARRAIQAAAVGGADEVLVRDPSEPAKINDFAEQEAGRPGGPDVEIVPAGLKPNRRRGALS